MSVSTPKRLFLGIIAVLIGTSAYASHPSPRHYSRTAYDVENRVFILFGGRGRPDRATGLTYDSNETWMFTGTNWIQQYPATSPPARTAHTMTYDGHGRVLVFGGSQEEAAIGGLDTLLNDLWAWKDGNWAQLETSGNGPSRRQFAGLVHDPERDVIVVYGGHEYLPLKPKQKTPDLGPVYDTWELQDGVWTRITLDNPKVARPLLVWDPVQKNVVMMGVDGTNATPVMYRYIDGAWTKENPAKLPTCVAEGYFMVQKDNRLLFVGGLCPTNTPGVQEVFEYDGSTWNKITIQGLNISRGLGQAVAYDSYHKRVIMYGGTTLAGGEPTSGTLFLTQGRSWIGAERPITPAPRSWMIFESDPLARGVALYGGLSETGGSYGTDSWQLTGGKWGSSPGVLTAPGECVNPLNTFDTDRNRLIALCSGNVIWEYDGTTWKNFASLDPVPDERRFSGIAYDAKLKKTVVFGGYFNDNYRNDTWLWDGTKWTELDIDNDDRPQHRGNFVMWYDAAQQKTLLYGGIGRPNINSKVTRFSDMWSFDGTRWTKMNVAQTPGIRFRPLVEVNPTTGKLLLFGGLRAENIDEDSIRQFYGDDTWEWDGASSAWTELHPEHRPPARQNGGMAWDATLNEMIMFGGWGRGFSYSDIWAWNGVDWRLIPDPFLGPKRRAVR